MINVNILINMASILIKRNVKELMFFSKFSFYKLGIVMHRILVMLH